MECSRGRAAAGPAVAAVSVFDYQSNFEIFSAYPEILNPLMEDRKTMLLNDFFVDQNNVLFCETILLVQLYGKRIS